MKSDGLRDRHGGGTECTLAESDGALLIMQPDMKQRCTSKKEPWEQPWDFCNDHRCQQETEALTLS